MAARPAWVSRYCPQIDAAASLTIPAASCSVISPASTKLLVVPTTQVTYRPWFLQLPTAAGPWHGQRCATPHPWASTTARWSPGARVGGVGYAVTVGVARRAGMHAYHPPVWRVVVLVLLALTAASFGPAEAGLRIRSGQMAARPAAGRISAGQAHTCLVQEDGAVRCWGEGSFGQLGQGTGKSSLTPVTVSDLTQAVAVGLGARSSCALTADGRAFCWGDKLGVPRGGVPLHGLFYEGARDGTVGRSVKNARGGH
jgi:hypothetical protein